MHVKNLNFYSFQPIRVFSIVMFMAVYVKQKIKNIIVYIANI